MNVNNISIVDIVKLLHQQHVIAYPTEAVFGLGCDPDSKKAVNKLLALKQRDWKKGLILVASHYDQLRPYIDDTRLSVDQCNNILSSWPGHVTWVFPAKTNILPELTGHFDTLAVRVSDHPLVRQLCLLYGKPLVSTSANLSGCKPCRTLDEVRSQFGFDLPILSGEVGKYVNPSEIRDALTGKQLRQG